jgi:hypothetical protein
MPRVHSDREWKLRRAACLPFGSETGEKDC